MKAWLRLRIRIWIGIEILEILQKDSQGTIDLINTKIGELQDENAELHNEIEAVRTAAYHTEPVKAPPRQARNWRQVVQFAEQGENNAS